MIGAFLRSLCGYHSDHGGGSRHGDIRSVERSREGIIMKAEESSSTTMSAGGSSPLDWRPRKSSHTALLPLVLTTESLCIPVQAITALALILTLVPGAAVYGACTPSGTNQKDTIVCNDADTVGVT